MSVEILGRREDQHLELKSEAALGEPSKIAREVVGMLNAGGGEIWIGVEDEDGVAVGVRAVPNPEPARDRLIDYLLETLDPSPLPEEVAIELRPAGADPALLVVKVQPQPERMGGTPYAFRKRGGWHFVRRMGARNHPMSRREIFGRPVRKGEDPAVEEAVRSLEQVRRTFWESGAREAGDSGLWLALAPARRLDLNLEDDRFLQIVLDPAVTGNRPSGWHFARTTRQPRPVKEGIQWEVRPEPRERPASRVFVTENGAALFWAAIERLHHKGEEREIWPLALLEYPISAFRIARVIYAGHLHPGDQVAADLALLGVGGWGLRPGTPGGHFSARARHPELRSQELARPEEPDLIWGPVVFDFREIDEAPDRCGFRLVRRVYHALGLRETEMPVQYDRQTGRLILPE